MSSTRSAVVIDFEEITKVYEKDGIVVAFDTDIFHIRKDNIGRSKSMDFLMRKLENQLREGTIALPVTKEI